MQAREQELLKEKEVAEARIIRLTQQLDQSQRRVKHNKEARDLEDQLKVNASCVFMCVFAPLPPSHLIRVAFPAFEMAVRLPWHMWRR